MIPQELLKTTESRAVGTVIYGGPGLYKTCGFHTFPYPSLLLDLEGGTGSLLPWIKRARSWDSSEWVEYTDQDREDAISKVSKDISVTIARPSPRIDVVYFDNMDPRSYEHLVNIIASFNHEYYNSIGIDSIQEFNFDIQTFSKNQAGVDVGSPMELKIWGGVQERSAIQLRLLRNYRNKGVFVYLTAGENIDKDYVTDPRSARKSEPQQEPYSVKGTVDVPGKLVSTVQHTTDIMGHARFLGANPVWVFQAESITSGSSAKWEAKDRYGRLDKYMQPNFRLMADMLYGKERSKEIYDYCEASYGSG